MSGEPLTGEILYRYERCSQLSLLYCVNTENVAVVWSHFFVTCTYVENAKNFLNCILKFLLIQADLDFVIPAPEVLNYDPLVTATDMWSIGVITYIL